MKPLKISLLVILLVWSWKIISNIFIYDDSYFEKSIYEIGLSALVQAVVIIVLVGGLTYLSKENLQDLGFINKKIVRQIIMGILFGLAIFIIIRITVDPLITMAIPKSAAQGIDPKNLFSNIYDLPLWIILAIFKGGFSEELWRIFTIKKFEKAFGRYGLIFALAAGSIIFGVGHLYQGISGFIAISITGFLFALVYLRKRSAMEAMAAHASFDLIGITLGYIIYG